jgi:hypothetical protein
MHSPHLAPETPTYPDHDLARLRSPCLHATLRRESIDLAYLLGAWASMVETGTQDWASMSFTSQDPRQLALIQTRVNALLGETPPLLPFSIHGVPYLRMNVPSVELTPHVREVTAGNTRIPWEHLGTEAECASFLQGVFDHGGWVHTGKCSGIGFNKKGGETLLEDLCRVFARVGVLPIVVYGEVASLKLKDQSEWKAFAKAIHFSLDERGAAVSKLASRISSRPHYTEEEYETVMALGRTTSLNSREIGTQIGIPTNTVRGWLTYGQSPPVVKRARIIEGFTPALGSPEVVNYVYRALGASSKLARVCGASCTMRGIDQTLAAHPDQRELVYGNDERIAALLLSDEKRVERFRRPSREGH